MELRIHAVGEVLTPLARFIAPWFQQVNRTLSGHEYGGPIKQLWIDVELYEYGMNVPERPPWPLRFQKRVAPRLPAGVDESAVYANVGHFSVRPSAEQMRADSPEEAARQVIAVILDSIDNLEGKRQIRGFDVSRFRRDLSDAFERTTNSSV